MKCDACSREIQADEHTMRVEKYIICLMCDDALEKVGKLELLDGHYLFEEKEKDK